MECSLQKSCLNESIGFRIGKEEIVVGMIYRRTFRI